MSDAYTGEPRIFVQVLRPIGDGHYAESSKEISLMAWERSRDAGQFLSAAICDALAELGYRSPLRLPR